MKTTDYQSALEIRFDSDAGEGVTVRDYFYKLLATLWHEEEGFSGKRPFGNSGWQHEVITPLIAQGFIPGNMEDGCGVPHSRRDAEAFIKQLIHVAFYGRPSESPEPTP